MVEYLEGAHNGEFVNSTMDNVAQQVQESNQKNPFHIPPTETLPSAVPKKCSHKYQASCNVCKQHKQWWTNYEAEVK